jgi:hypothetical protein
MGASGGKGPKLIALVLGAAVLGIVAFFTAAVILTRSEDVGLTLEASGSRGQAITIRMVGFSQVTAGIEGAPDGPYEFHFVLDPVPSRPVSVAFEMVNHPMTPIEVELTPDELGRLTAGGLHLMQGGWRVRLRSGDRWAELLFQL